MDFMNDILDMREYLHAKREVPVEDVIKIMLEGDIGRYLQIGVGHRSLWARESFCGLESQETQG